MANLEVDGIEWQALTINAISLRTNCYDGVGMVICKKNEFGDLGLSISKGRARVRLKDKYYVFDSGTVLFLDPNGKLHDLKESWPLPCDEDEAGEAIDEHGKRIIKKNHEKMLKLSQANPSDQ